MSVGISVLLVNYQRPQNMWQIIDRLREQKGLDVQILLWDNAGRMEAFQVDEQYSGTENLHWHVFSFLATRARHPLLLSMDDDLMPADDRLLADVVARHRTEGVMKPRSIMCSHGVRLSSCGSYSQGEHFVAVDEKVHIAKGRFAVMERSAGCRLRWRAKHHHCDIHRSFELAAGNYDRPQHWCSSVFHNRLVELPAGTCGYDQQPGHWVEREALCESWANRRYFRECCERD